MDRHAGQRRPIARRRRIWAIPEATLAVVKQRGADHCPTCPMGRCHPARHENLDIVVGLDVIADSESQKLMANALQARDFQVKDPRWQFEKKFGDRSIIVDLHSALPASKNPNLQMDKLRVKHKPSLGADGIHGRQNREAIGSDQHPFGSAIEGIKIAVPNPVAWSVMKLTALRDRWVKAEDQSRPEADRAFHRDQAMKHARDVCRIVAMTTRDERDLAVEVIKVIHAKGGFVDAGAIQRKFFGDADGWDNLVGRTVWQADDQALIRSTLADWFR
jgi:hypothetical protein